MIKRLCVVITVVLLVLVMGGCAPPIHYRVSGEYSAQWSSVQLPADTFVATSAGATMSESQYKRQCIHVSYKDFENDLNAHKGEDVYFKGDMAFIGPAGDIPMAGLRAVPPGRLASVSLVPADAPDNAQAMVWLIWPEPLPLGVHEGGRQIVEVWGECQGAAYADAMPPSLDATNMPVVRARYMTVLTW